MIGKIAGNVAIVKVVKELERKNFGQKKGNYLYLHPIEAVYLQLKGKIKISNLQDLLSWAEKNVQNFIINFIVYEDLRSRGIRIKPAENLLVGKNVYYPLSEDENLEIPSILNILSKYNMLTLAFVDEECDVTYIRVSPIKLEGKQVEFLPKISGIAVGDRVIVIDNEDIHSKYFYGAKKSEFIILSPIEALYLLERDVLNLININKDKFLNRLRKDNSIKKLYDLYKFLKEKNFVVKTGFKFGSEFRIYSCISSISALPHSEFLVSVANDQINASDVVRLVRLAQSVRKKLILFYKNNFLWLRRVKI
ncbi:tRNA-intron lyase [Archaeoglobales archaeon ex4484_92]|nr:MAG: tRNA-intron lyase [Archaeoglobales archaeon ex4484_92]